MEYFGKENEIKYRCSYVWPYGWTGETCSVEGECCSRPHTVCFHLHVTFWTGRFAGTKVVSLLPRTGTNTEKEVVEQWREESFFLGLLRCFKTDCNAGCPFYESSLRPLKWNDTEFYFFIFDKVSLCFPCCLQTPGFTWSSCLSSVSSWDYMHVPGKHIWNTCIFSGKWNKTPYRPSRPRDTAPWQRACLWNTVWDLAPNQNCVQNKEAKKQNPELLPSGTH